MKRLLIAGAVAVGLHGLLFSTKMEWMEKRVLRPLPSDPLAVVLTYKQPEKQISLPKKGPERIEKITVPTQKIELKEKPKPDPSRKVEESRETPKPKPPQKLKPRTTVKKTQPPKKEKKAPPDQFPEPALRPFNEPPAADEAVEVDNKEFALHKESTAEPYRSTDLPNEAELTLKASLPSTREAIPLYRENPPPRYPRIARRKGYEGTVVLEVLVSPEGKVDVCRVLRSSGHSVLDKAAVKAIGNWLFEPGMRGEKKVEMWVKVPIRFDLK